MTAILMSMHNAMNIIMLMNAFATKLRNREEAY